MVLLSFFFSKSLGKKILSILPRIIFSHPNLACSLIPAVINSPSFFSFHFSLVISLFWAACSCLPSPSSHVETLSPHGRVLRGEGVWGLGSLNEVMRVEPPRWDQCLCKERRSLEKGFVCKPGGVFCICCTCWGLDLPTSQPPKRWERKNCLLFEPPSLWYLVRTAWTKILLRFVPCLCTSLGPLIHWFSLFKKKKKHFSFLLQPFPQLLHPHLKPSWTPASVQPVLLFSLIKELLSFLESNSEEQFNFPSVFFLNCSFGTSWESLPPCPPEWRWALKYVRWALFTCFSDLFSAPSLFKNLCYFVKILSFSRNCLLPLLFASSGMQFSVGSHFSWSFPYKTLSPDLVS